MAETPPTNQGLVKIKQIPRIYIYMMNGAHGHSWELRWIMQGSSFLTRIWDVIVILLMGKGS